MKGIIMFDNLNDLAFFDADEDLTQHIQNLAIKDGLLETMSLKNSEGVVDKNVVMQIFSPLIASYKVMQAQFGNKYKYIESEDGVFLVFNELLNYIIISICYKDEHLPEIQQELSLFVIFVRMLYGPSLHMIKNTISTCCDKISRAELIPCILNKWRSLKMEQQMFLVEAIERLIINQDITAMCINLLQEILEKIRHTHKDGTYSHAFALVDSKLLALYSSRNSGQLPKRILLSLILIAQVLKTSSVVETLDETEKYSDDEYFLFLKFFIPISANVAKEKASFYGNKSKRKTKNPDKIKSDKLKNGAQSLLLYMKSRLGPLVPHILYVVEVTHKITLIILCELTNYGAISSLISSIVTSLHNLQCHPISRQPLGSFEALETEYRSLLDGIWKLKTLNNKEKHMKTLISKWEHLKQCDIEAFFHISREKNINPRLDSAVSSLCDVLKMLFEETVATPCLNYERKTQEAQHLEILVMIQKLSLRRLNDVADFLEVKAVQNITMSSYITEYPGLIHFIYIDRSCDCLIAPAVVLKKGHLNGATSLKKKIWKMVTFGRRYLDGVNKFCCLWKADDLYYFYTIWFENSTGRVIKPDVYPNLKKFPQKGILCGNFFKKLVRECFPNASYEHIFCYELFLVHLESTSTDAIVDHSRRLCSQLWDFTGAYRTSLDLL